MWSGENQGSDFSVSSFGLAVPQLVKGRQQQLEPSGPGSDHDVNCGMLGFYPAFLQSYRTPRCYLIFLCLLGMTQGFVVNGLVSVVTPTIEKRFQLLGIEVGVIQSMFNVASCIMTTPVSYHGGVGHKPVIMGIGALVVSAGSMVFASPHFLAPQYMALDSSATDVCPQRGSGHCGALALSGATSTNAFKYFFMVGHALHGVGSSPFFTLGVAYLDQNTPSASASIYMAATERAKDLTRLQKEKEMKSLKQAPGAADVQVAPEVQGIPDVQDTAFQAPSDVHGAQTTLVTQSGSRTLAGRACVATRGNQFTPGTQATPSCPVAVGAQGAPNHDGPQDMQIATEPTVGRSRAEASQSMSRGSCATLPSSVSRSLRLLKVSRLVKSERYSDDLFIEL
ncbi:hypothetical protein HPB50_004881 [Hyalomma asiaticum]|uniref:Uncharacterized protein n=1 Tax=Hyalomma asiaticum TaxID=266040 RepID=A0ACB7SE42_HYAAI|nr:hypothetical protein HPB50_004881 [Hyalomma asiaticum]